MAEKIGDFYPTQVPSYTEAADIRKAFNLYHYGTEEVPASEEDILSQSMAGYIRDVLAAVEAADIGETVVSPLDDTDNLNFSEAVSSGIYKSAINLTAEQATELNYPINSLGLLSFTKTTDSTFFQTYISVSDGGYWWRVGVKPQVDVVWGLWQKAAESNHTHDTRYYTQSQINAKVGMTGMTASRAAIVDSTGKLTSSTTTQADLEKVGGLSASGILGANPLHTYLSALAGKLPSNQKIYVQSATPTGAVPGDIWLW